MQMSYKTHKLAAWCRISYRTRNRHTHTEPRVPDACLATTVKASYSLLPWSTGHTTFYARCVKARRYRVPRTAIHYNQRGN